VRLLAAPLQEERTERATLALGTWHEQAKQLA
jgi:hypothetical protein